MKREIDYGKLEMLCGGAPRGEDHPQAKVTEDIVREIRRLHADGYGYIRIARSVGLSQAQVQRIVSRKAWSHVS